MRIRQHNPWIAAIHEVFPKELIRFCRLRQEEVPEFVGIAIACSAINEFTKADCGKLEQPLSAGQRLADFFLELDASGTGDNKFPRKTLIVEPLQEQPGIFFALNFVDKNHTVAAAQLQPHFLKKGALG